MKMTSDDMCSCSLVGSLSSSGCHQSLLTLLDRAGSLLSVADVDFSPAPQMDEAKHTKAPTMSRPQKHAPGGSTSDFHHHVVHQASNTAVHPTDRAVTGFHPIQPPLIPWLRLFPGRLYVFVGRVRAALERSSFFSLLGVREHRGMAGSATQRGSRIRRGPFEGGFSAPWGAPGPAHGSRRFFISFERHLLEGK